MEMIDLIRDTAGKISSKRVVTLVAFFIYAFAFCWDIFQEMEIQTDLLDGMFYIVCVGITASTGEPYFRKTKGDSTNEQ